MHSGHGPERLNQLDADLGADVLGIRCLLNPFHEPRGDAQAGNALAHAVGHLDGLEGQDAGKNVGALVQAELPYLFHPDAEAGDVEDGLGLDEVRARSDLLAQAEKSEPGGIDKGIGDGPDVRGDLARDALAIHEEALVPQRLDHLHEMDGVDVVDAHGGGLIAHARVVARQAKDVAYAEGRRSEQVALQGQAVAVADHHLQHRLDSRLLEQNASGKARHPHHGDLVVGDVHGVAGVLEEFAFLDHDLRRAPPGRSGFGGDGELAAIEGFVPDGYLTSRSRSILVVHVETDAHGARMIPVHVGLLTESSRARRWHQYANRRTDTFITRPNASMTVSALEPP